MHSSNSLRATNGILRTLKTNYDIQIVVAEPVEVELRLIIKRDKFKDAQNILTKGFSSGLLGVLDETRLSSLVGTTRAPTVLESIENRGESFRRLGVGNGEAFTHSASVELNMPVLSNDRQAIDLLTRNGIALPGPFLRAFDILVFGRQIGLLSDGECDEARQALAKRGENLDKCFTNCSFTNGLPHFYPRLLDRAFPLVGSQQPSKLYDRQQLIISAK